ncbi:MAG: DUF1203 domain-containing protein [Pyrinomonadaceae bacterium]
MSKFRVRPIKPEIAQAIRETMLDEAGHQLVISIATENGYGPCRSCLKQFTAGEQRILFTYRPNPVDHPYDESGPVIIHAEPCEPYQTTETFPPEVENGRIKFPLVFRTYDAQGRMIGGQPQNGEPASAVIETLFQNDQVAVVQVRNGLVGCFVAQIDRAV